MIKQSTTPKRGVTLFTVIETGEEVKYYSTDPDGNYLVDFPNGSYQTFSPDELKPLQKKGTPISNKPKKQTEVQISDSKAMNNFFDSLDCPIYCDECKAPLIAYTKFGKRSCSAHLLPKAYFESVKTEPLNIMFLGAGFLGGCRCHDIHDSNVDSRKAMKIYPEVLRRFHQFKHKLTTDEHIAAYEYLGIELTTDILNEFK